MKAFVVAMIVAALAGCTSRTEFGPCIGVGEDKDPKLVYKVSAWNLFVGFVFIEMLVPPIIVAVDQTFCPVGRK